MNNTNCKTFPLCSIQNFEHNLPLSNDIFKKPKKTSANFADKIIWTHRIFRIVKSDNSKIGFFNIVTFFFFKWNRRCTKIWWEFQTNVFPAKSFTNDILYSPSVHLSRRRLAWRIKFPFQSGIIGERWWVNDSCQILWHQWMVSHPQTIFQKILCWSPRILIERSSGLNPNAFRTAPGNDFLSVVPPSSCTKPNTIPRSSHTETVWFGGCSSVIGAGPSSDLFSSLLSFVVPFFALVDDDDCSFPSSIGQGLSKDSSSITFSSSPSVFSTTRIWISNSSTWEISLSTFFDPLVTLSVGYRAIQWSSLIQRKLAIRVLDEVPKLFFPGKAYKQHKCKQKTDQTRKTNLQIGMNKNGMCECWRHLIKCFCHRIMIAIGFKMSDFWFSQLRK